MTKRTREASLVATFVAMADSLVDDYDVVDLLQRLVEDCVELFDATAAGIVLRTPSGELEVIVSTSEQSQFIELLQLRVGEGPCVEAITTGRAVSVEDLNHVAERWPAFAADARQSGYSSVHSMPLRLRTITIGSLNLFRDRIGTLNAPDASAAQALSDVATISILQQRIAEESALTQQQLQRALDSRVIIEQAKGQLAQQRNIETDQAFDLIRSHARSTQTRLGEVAARIVARQLEL